MSILELADRLRDESKKIAREKGIPEQQAFYRAIELFKKRCELV